MSSKAGYNLAPLNPGTCRVRRSEASALSMALPFLLALEDPALRRRMQPPPTLHRQEVCMGLKAATWPEYVQVLKLRAWCRRKGVNGEWACHIATLQ